MKHESHKTVIKASCKIFALSRRSAYTIETSIYRRPTVHVTFENCRSIYLHIAYIYNTLNDRRLSIITQWRIQRNKHLRMVNIS